VHVLSSTSDYALRAILALAGRKTGGSMRAEEIARATGAPSNYLAKTMNLLAKEGIVTSARGPQGGFALAIPADELSLARIIDCFDEPRTHSRCLLGTAPCDPLHPCSAHDRWTRVVTSRRAALSTTTIADLLAL
jgi:Rrf2 family protein